MFFQSFFLFFSVFCAITRAAPTSNPVKRSSASRGLLYAPGPGLTPFSGQVSWSANWATASSAGSVDLGAYVSQYWGIDSIHAGNFVGDAGNYNGVNLLGYNEPDIVTQSWLSPQQAINGWGVINNYKGSNKIGTPAVSNSVLAPQEGTSAAIGDWPANYIAANPQGHDWLSQFLDLASGQYTFDFLNFHWYGGSANTLEQDQAMMQTLVDNMVGLATAHGIQDVWITEMKVQNSATECQFISWFETTFLPANPAITHYAYNQQEGSLNNGAGLSAAGAAYLGQGSC